ncbi:hypothetical protein [Dethiosulfatarculus sandiegensis]|uniref:Uncharacterized protein n=1 Tax=Dethiosulfatarculus sandiegensis TaxID=1429043 RepID=A0A0D2JK81_9BACT|nr:hypothetical protein [Dethiosulfatarculus sandiegensis]KIX16021.1 hypothetical protein X474_00235 [Dethiosulfatarculus sandiegensis]
MLAKFLKREKKPLSTDQVLKKAKEILPMLDGLVNRLFQEFSSELLSMDPEAIVPAVWGTDKEGQMNRFQSKVHQQVRPVVNDVLGLLHLEELDGSDRFAVECLIRELLIAKLAFMMEGTKNRLMRELVSEDPMELYSQQIQTVGSA